MHERCRNVGRLQRAALWLAGLFRRYDMPLAQPNQALPEESEWHIKYPPAWPLELRTKNNPTEWSLANMVPPSGKIEPPMPLIAEPYAEYRTYEGHTIKGWAALEIMESQREELGRSLILIRAPAIAMVENASGTIK